MIEPARRGQQQKAHDALAVHLPALPRHLHPRLKPRGQVHELRRRPRVHAELVHDGHDGIVVEVIAHESLSPPAQQIRRHPDGASAHGRASRAPRPAGRSSCSSDASLISIGRLTPVMTSSRSVSRNVMPRFDGVPPNMSVSSSTPASPLHPLDGLRDVLARVVHVVVPADRHGRELRQVADDHLRGVHQLGRQLPVRDDDDADHVALGWPVDAGCRDAARGPARPGDARQRAPQALGNHHRAMAPAGAADRDRQIALPFRDVERQHVRQVAPRAAR